MSGKSTVFHVAIDGPVAAGKGTISRLVSQRLGILYIDTGAMYRMTALLALNASVDPRNEDEVCELLKHAKIQMRNPNELETDGRLTSAFLDDEDVSWKIRTEEIGMAAAMVAIHPKVRELLVSKQQQIAHNQSVVMEGRDITFRVLPNANLKIYLTASITVRSKRRHLQLLSSGQDLSFEEVYKDLQERDRIDMNRKVDPLHIVDDAWELNTSDLEIEKVVNLIVARAELLMSNI